MDKCLLLVMSPKKKQGHHRSRQDKTVSFSPTHLQNLVTKKRSSDAIHYLKEHSPLLKDKKILIRTKNKTILNNLSTALPDLSIEERDLTKYPSATLQTILECLQEMNAFEMEGLFRLTKNEERVRYLLVEFESLHKEELLKEDPYDLASLLKAWARNPKKQPIFKTCNEMISLINGGQPAITGFLNSLTEEEREFILILQRTSQEIVEKSFYNKMSWEGMARVVGPNLYRNKDPFVEMSHIKVTIEATLLLLQNGKEFNFS